MRGTVEGFPSPHPLAEQLPGVYLEDSFAQRFLAAFDEMLGPVFSSLDNLEAYFDAWNAPRDFLDWLGGWLGLALDESWPVERSRAFIAAAMDLYRIRGTPRGLAEHVKKVTGSDVEVEESGGATWSTLNGDNPPGRPGYELVVRLRLDDPSEANLAKVQALVAAIKPAHVVHRVELLKV
jgi:phage tail-like protein